MRDTGIRVGRVSSVDYQTGMMQVVYPDKDNAVTTNMPYANFNDEYCMPKVGEQVLVAHLTNGSSRGVVLGTMWNKKNIPEESGKTLFRKELSKTKGAAYIRYEDDSGEYLIKVPKLILHGVDQTDVEGPEVNIAANLRTSFESPEHKATMQSILMEGLQGADIECEIANNVRISMDASELQLLILKAKIELLEELNILAGTNIKIHAVNNVQAISDNDVVLEDKTFQTTLSGIMGRLEALDGDTAARK